MLQSLHHAGGEPAPSHHAWRWHGFASAATLVVLTAVSVEAGHEPAHYVAAVLGAAWASYVLYLAVTLRRWAEREVMPMLHEAHRRTPSTSFARWMALDMGTLGVVDLTPEDASMHIELGTLSPRHLA